MPRRKQGCRELPKDTPPRAIKPGEWADVIGNGVTTENPLGEKVTLTQDVEKDWKNKSRKEREWRQRNLPYALETLKNPHEIWQGYKGNKVHVSRYAEDTKNHQPERVVNVVTHGETVVTYYVEKRNPEKWISTEMGSCCMKEMRLMPGMHQPNDGSIPTGSSWQV